MQVRELEYQSKVLKAVDAYLETLADSKLKMDKVIAANATETDPDLVRTVPDYTAKAWGTHRLSEHFPASRKDVPFSPRTDGIGRAVPNVVLKIPTGGGKTYLAVSVVSRVFGRFLGRNYGFVLWIVPNEAIFSQTWKQLNDRSHPYRQVLERAAAGKVKLLTKESPLDATDVGTHMCVMLVMLQAENRQTKDALKMFQDRGDVRGFFPSEGDQNAHAAALEATPNLDIYDLGDGRAGVWPLVKDSVGNVLRQIRPVVVMDEGHRAVAELAFATLYGFNPSFVVELSATPKDVAATTGDHARTARPANVLVDVRGIDVDREGMIKMPMNLLPRHGTDWHDTLRVALERLNLLDIDAARLHAEQGRYLRPILLVQVERTGSDQRDGALIHALDVKEWLKKVGIAGEEIAIKTAETNDLANPESQELLSPLNRVRVIITKQALQEGWDCPFAYVLCALAASTNPSGLTQLVGRILRQPDATKTGISALDECYVITHHAQTSGVVAAIKHGLESDGLGDLVKQVRVKGSGDGDGGGPRPVQRRQGFAKTEIFLPSVLSVDGPSVRPLDYDCDVLAGVTWEDLDIEKFVASIPLNLQNPDAQMRRIRLSDSDEKVVSETVGQTGEDLSLDPTYMVRMLSDIVVNPWVARAIVGRVIDGLRARAFSDSKLGSSAGLLLSEMRRWLDRERDVRAETFFRAEVKAGRIQFRLRSDGKNWSMPFEAQTYEPLGADQLVSNDGGPLKRSLFSPIYKGDFSSKDERDIAVYVDGEKALQWWHRNVARSQYSLVGWRRDRFFPDFILARPKPEGGSRLVVLEIKGEHLAGNDDTEYKRKLMHLMAGSYQFEAVGAMTLEGGGTVSVETDLVLMGDWPTRLPSYTT